ncbi:MAG: GntR family transcriptional regulator [Pseudooceanicola sp.]|nr:GntR family transcriptional regulator [Pseudooceanicola sp.]
MTTDFTVRREPPLSAKVGERLRQMLATQVFEPGDRLVEEDLARRLSVSRTPVREALFRLEQAGLVEQRDGGFHVPRLSLRDVHEIFQIRRLIEPQAVSDIAEIVTAADLALFRKGRDRLMAADNVEDSAAANIAFRGLWLARIPNRRMLDVLARFDDQVVMVRRATLLEPAARQAARDGVRALVAAFEARDAQAARRVMEGFIDSALHWFEREVETEA